MLVLLLGLLFSCRELDFVVDSFKQGEDVGMEVASPVFASFSLGVLVKKPRMLFCCLLAVEDAAELGFLEREGVVVPLGVVPELEAFAGVRVRAAPDFSPILSVQGCPAQI